MKVWPSAMITSVPEGDTIIVNCQLSILNWFDGGSMDIRVNDILTMKKNHPCGEKRWLVLRTGADFRLRCMGCGHELMTPRFKAEKNIRSVERKEETE